MATTPALWLSGIQDNATDNGLQQDSGVVATTTGDAFYAVWRDSGNFNTGHSAIVGRHFDALGNPVGGDVVLNPLNNAFAVPFNASQPATVRLPRAGQADGTATAFTDNFNNGGDFDTYVVRTDASLSRLEAPLLIDGSLAHTTDPSVTSFADGGLVVSYTIQNSTTDWDIWARTVSPAGVVGPVITIFNDTDRSDLSDLATLTNGNFVAVFESPFLGSPTDLDVFFTIKTENGTNVVSPTTVRGAGGTATETNPHVAALANGGFVVTWTDSAGDVNGTSYGIRATVYDANGNVTHGDILVNVLNQAGTQFSNDVTALPDGGFVVAWEDITAGVDRAQRFDSAGNLVGAPVTIANSATFDVNAATYSDGRSIFTINDFSTGNYNTVSSIWDTRHNDTNMVSGSNFAGSSTADVMIERDSTANNTPGGIRTYLAQSINNALPGASTTYAIVGSDWTLDANGDFNADGLADMVARRDAGGVRHLDIFSTGSNGSVAADMPIAVLGTDWVVNASGDFNHDGFSDILISRDASGLRTYDLMNIVNNQVQSTTQVAITSSNTILDGSGDFNGDGTPDFLYHTDSGGVRTLQIQDMQNGHPVGGAPVVAQIGSAWQIDGMGDFNGDGYADILMHQDVGNSRQLGLLTVQNNAVTGFQQIGVVGTNVQIQAVGNFEGTGKPDLLIQSIAGFGTASAHNVTQVIEIDNSDPNHITTPVANTVAVTGVNWQTA